MNFLDKLERKFGRFAIPQVTIYIIMGQILAWAMSFARPDVYQQMVYIPGLVLDGEAWRLFSFILIPPLSHPILMLIAWYVFFLMGNALEAQWGSFKYNAYLLLGTLVVLAAGFLFPYNPVSNGFLGLSVFFAFAYLFPNFEFMLFFVLPVKVKWLGWIGAGMLLIGLLLDPWSSKILALASVSNFLVFFGKDIYQFAKSKKRMQEIKAQKKVEAETPFHVCVKCGATDLSHPDRYFRYREEGAVCSACLEQAENGEVS